MQPPTDIISLDYPFQQLCFDYFSHNNHDYVVIVDRYSSWPMVFRSEAGAKGLVRRLRETFVTFGVPEVLTSDGGPQFTAGKIQEFMKSCGVHHRLTSVENPHSSSRVEVAVKTVKRMLMDNKGLSGLLDVDRFQRAMLILKPEHRQPSYYLAGPSEMQSQSRYCPDNTWQETLTFREKALARRHSR
ncbi:hypothetical protein RRG08_022224 [Elysia crispata]|uniref:Integrase catalytic domain-containing protein n=1 Tax=Elysia crispata TaxID=231223 RepID=A0AAE0ZQ74_9GAST|nr:hypothetical protein RRG08_022224 [Elysia crispata]